MARAAADKAEKVDKADKPEKPEKPERKTKSSTSAAAGGGGKKKTTPYNVYMKTELAHLKEKFPDMPHKERFKTAATSWATAPANPKNKKE